MDEAKIIGFGFCLILILIGVAGLVFTGGNLIQSWRERRRVRRQIAAVGVVMPDFVGVEKRIMESKGTACGKKFGEKYCHDCPKPLRFTCVYGGKPEKLSVSLSKGTKHV